MSTTDVAAPLRLAELRDDFDRSFAQPCRRAALVEENLLGIRVAGQRYAFRLAEISALVADRHTTWLPGTGPGLLGVARLRGAILPVVDLAPTLGHPPAPAPRWLVVTAATPALALAFGVLDGQLRVRADAIAPLARGAGRSFLTAVVRQPGGTWTLVDTAAVRQAVVGSSPADPLDLNPADLNPSDLDPANPDPTGQSLGARQR